MTNFTQDDFHPHPATILFIKQFARFIKQFARMCNTKKNLTNGYNGIPVAACS